MGLPQFMPGSVNRCAVDFDGDGHIDLNGSAADVVGSVAHYLAGARLAARHGARTYTVAAAGGQPRRATLLQPDILPSFSAAQLPSPAPSSTTPAAPTPDRWRWWNCRTATRRRATSPARRTSTRVTRYNWSSYYAMAVITLGEAVRRQR